MDRQPAQQLFRAEREVILADRRDSVSRSRNGSCNIFNRIRAGCRWHEKSAGWARSIRIVVIEQWPRVELAAAHSVLPHPATAPDAAQVI